MKNSGISIGAYWYLMVSQGLGNLPEIPKPFSQVVWTLGSLWRAICLGLLDANALNEITWSFYMSKTGFETEEFNIHQGLWPWEANAIQTHFKGEKRVLVAGAGGGREVIALANLGYDVTGFDFSLYLTAACRRNAEKAGYTVKILEAPPDEVPDGLRDFDALLIGRGFYHHIPGHPRRIAFLRACRATLKPGAPVILSDFYTRVPNSRFYLRTQTLGNLLRKLQRSAESIELGDWLSNCFQHAFTREEIEKEFLEAGLKLEYFAISPFSEDSRLAHVVGRAA